MAKKAARTAWGPMVQVVLEQFMPQGQRIVQDALAYRFLPAPLRLLVSVGRPAALRKALWGVIDGRVPGIRGGILCRKRYIDEKLMEALHAGMGAVVILGAGMDTRAYRIPSLSAVPVYEVDLPDNIETKKAAVRRVLGQVPAHVRWVPVDFDEQEVGSILQEAGFSAEAPSFFILEGVTQYISEAAVHKLFEFLKTADRGSRLVFTYIRRDFIDGQKMYDLEMLYRQTRARREFWQYGMEPGGVAAFLESYGWRELEQAGSAEYQECYVRPAGRTMPVMAVERAVLAEKV